MATGEFGVAKSELELMTVERDFWRRATQTALEAMSRAEDERDEILSVVREALDDLNTAWVRSGAPEAKALDKLAALVELDEEAPKE